MNPFKGAGARSGSWAAGRLGKPALLVALLLCLTMGLGLAAWRTRADAENRRARAGAEARVLALALEAQLDRANAAAELLAMMTRQGGTTINFQKAAAEVLATRPGIDSVDLQPGGIVSDVYPRAGHERLLGFNSLRNPAYQNSANAARQRRTVTVAGPLRLSRGAIGLVVIAPVFSPASGRPESFWGFVTASVAVPEMLARARINELAAQGYDSVLFLSGGGEQGAVVLGESGHASLRGGIQQPVRFGNLDLRISVQARGGWIDSRALICRCAMVLLMAGLVCFTLIVLNSRQGALDELANARQQLAALATARTQWETERHRVQDSAAASQAELLQLRSALHESERTKSDLQARLEEAARTAAETDRTSTELRHQLDRVEGIADRTGQTQLEQRNQDEATIQTLRAQLEQTARAEKETTTVAQRRSEQDRATIAELHGRLDKALNAAKETARLSQAERERAEASLDEAQQAVRALQTRLDQANAQLASAQTAAQVQQRADRESIAELRAELQRLLTSPAQPSEEDRPTETQHAISSAPSTEQPSAPGNGKETSAPPETEAPQDSLLELNSPSPPAPAATKLPKPARRKREAPEDQMNLWSSADVAEQPPLEESLQLAAPSKEPGSGPSRAAAPGQAPAAELRRAFHQILPLLADHDPGAADCLKDNRNLFRAVFTPADYAEFQEWTRTGQFAPALEHLKRAARKHGISL